MVSYQLLEKNCHFVKLKIQAAAKESVHISNNYTIQDRDSHSQSFYLNFGSSLARDNIRSSLQAANANAEFRGLSISRDKQHFDQHIFVDHKSAHTTSTQKFKSILFDQSRYVFNGKQIEANQLNNNLMLSENAEVDTRPQLLIDNDDVKCSHGATIGQLNDAELFYLTSRGIAKEIARSMLCKAFARELIEDCHDQIKNLIDGHLTSVLQEGE